MKRIFGKLFAICLAVTLIVPVALFAGGSKHDKCKTKYPIILAHGMGATDDMLGFINYWWKIEEALEDEGAVVYVTKVNCMDSTDDKAQQFKAEFLRVKEATRAAKINIIGHSHGTIYTRHAMTNYGIGSMVSSHTSMAGPHRGSAVADVILDIVPDSGEWLVGAVIDAVYGFLMGDVDGNTIANAYDLTRDNMVNVFNPNCQNLSTVYYQSYATKIKTVTPELVLQPTWLLLLFYEGANDGLVSTTSAQWGTFRGVESGAWWCGGVSHYNSVNQLFGLTPGIDVPGWYVNIVNDLKKKGY